MSVDYRAIGQRIQRKRKGQKKTQDDLAEALSVSVGYISQIERGVTKINLDTLSEIANSLGCDIAELVTGVAPAREDYLSRELERAYGALDRQQRGMLLEMANLIGKYTEGKK